MRASRYFLVLPQLGRQAVSTLSLACCLALLAHGSQAVEPSATPVTRQSVAPAADSMVQRNSKAKPTAPATQRATVGDSSRLNSTRPTLAQAAEASATAQQAPPLANQPRVKPKRKTAAKPPQVQLLPQADSQRADSQRADPRQAELLARQTADRVRELLLRARRSAAGGRLTEPSTENAAALYQEVLALDPMQTEALAGVERIVAVLTREVEFAAVAGDKARARAYVAQIRSLQPAAGALLELDARVQALEASPVSLSTRQQDRYSLSAQSIDRAKRYLDNQPLDLRTIDQALDEYDRAAALAPSAPGLPLLKERITVLFPEATRRELAGDNSKRALKLVETARQRGWSTAELDPLEAEAKATMRPGRYDTTFAECPDSVAQACKQAPLR